MMAAMEIVHVLTLLQTMLNANQGNLFVCLYNQCTLYFFYYLCYCYIHAECQEYVLGESEITFMFFLVLDVLATKTQELIYKMF